MKLSLTSLIALFALVMIVGLLSVVDWSAPPAFVVERSSDGELDLRKTVPIEAGAEILARGQIRTKEESNVISYEGTVVEIGPFANVEVRSIADDRLEFFSTRGAVRINPDREIKYCTRAVCIQTESIIDIIYYAPDEAVEVLPSGDAAAVYKGQTYLLKKADTFYVDELAGTVRLQPFMSP